MLRIWSYKPGFLVALLLASPVAVASQLLVDVTGNRINYSTDVTVGTSQTTASWSNTSVHPAYAWQPGQLVSGLGNHNLILTGSAGQSIRLTLNILGVAYGGIAEGFTESMPPGGLNTNTVTGKRIGNTLVVDSGAAGMFANTLFTSSTSDSHTPFTLVRPMFSFNARSLLAELSGLKSETFQGVIPLSYKYRVQHVAGGIWSYEVRPFNMTVAVKYLAAALENILVAGSGVLNTTYATGTTEVRGEASYTVQAKGVMPFGIRMRFLQPGRRFELQKAANEPTIPYNLKCTSASATCQINRRRTVELVKNGTFMGGNTGIVLIKPDQEQSRDFVFNLDVDFTSGFVPPGHYQDDFVVMFDVLLQ